MAPRSRSFRLGHARHGAVVASYYSAAFDVFPWLDSAADLDFIHRQYRWNNANRTEADFTTLVLNGATFGAQGLDFTTCTVNPNITITLAALGLAMPPCVHAAAGYFQSTPAANKTLYQFDDGTNAERFLCNLNVNPVVAFQVVDNSAVQSAQSPGSIGSAAGVRFGVAVSVQLNEVLAAGNGIAATADTVATMPTVTQLRIGCNNAATSFPPGILSRIVIFSAVKTQSDINTLSAQIQVAT